MQNKYFKVVLVSFIILFLELLLIRLVGTEIRIFAYFSNLLLLGIFVGSGVGMLIKKSLPISYSAVLLAIVTAILVFGLMDGVTDKLSPLSESFLWFQTPDASTGQVVGGLLLTMLLLFMVAGIFVPLGRILGELLEDKERLILVYSVNVFASLAGMWAVAMLPVFGISLFFGLAAMQLAMVFLAKNRFQKAVVLACFLLSISLAFANRPKNGELTLWSPYQKLSLAKLPQTGLFPTGYMLRVNNVGYMGLLDLSADYKARVKNSLPPAARVDLRFYDQYEMPFFFKPGAQDVLVVGAGGGNDAAAAVRAKAARIDAVEIDPKIIELGRQYHPERPYSAPQVTVYNNDGRAFFKRNPKKYDLVIMGLADSHTLSSSLANVRLDHYLYTTEAFREIKNILKPGGMLFLAFDVRREWIGGRIQKGLAEAFGAKPLVFSMQDASVFGWGGVMFAAGEEPMFINNILEANADLKKFIASRQINYNQEINSLTDNWPYLYLDQPRPPRIHLWISLFLLIFIIFFRGLTRWQGRLRWDFFFLGAGFLLLEFQNISKISLLFGNTWMTNLFSITFILILILAANLIQAKKPLPLKHAYIGLILSLAAQMIVPLSVLNNLPEAVKLSAGLLFLHLPFLFSGIIFIEKLKNAESKAGAFASNLLGSAIGGILEMFSFVFGIQALLVLSLGLYLCSFIPGVRLKRTGLL